MPLVHVNIAVVSFALMLVHIDASEADMESLMSVGVSKLTS